MKNNFNISKMNFDDLEIIKPVLKMILIITGTTIF